MAAFRCTIRSRLIQRKILNAFFSKYLMVNSRMCMDRMCIMFLMLQLTISLSLSLNLITLWKSIFNRIILILLVSFPSAPGKDLFLWKILPIVCSLVQMLWIWSRASAICKFSNVKKRK